MKCFISLAYVQKCIVRIDRQLIIFICSVNFTGKILKKLSLFLFSAIESLYFEECNLQSKMTQFNEWFPKLQKLCLFTNRLNPTCIAAKFPYLEHLATEINHGRSTDIGKNAIEKVIRLNSQLRSLYIRVDTAEKFVFGDFIKIISQNPSIEKLQTHWYYAHSLQNTEVLSQITRAMPFLIEIHFTGLVFQNDEIIRFVNQNPTLKKFSFALHMTSSYKLLLGALNTNWKVSRNQNYLITLKR